MALDIRLDYIRNIRPEIIDRMTEIRRKFIDLDGELQDISDEIDEIQDPAGARTIALARTNLEIASQFSVKSLCILGEIK